MTPPHTELEDLIQKLEKATGPDRELDGEIYLFLHPEMRQLSETATGSIKPEHYSSPVYTTSIDAALTLAPEGFAYVLTNQGRVSLSPLACVSSDERISPDAPHLPKHIVNVRARTVPLAICIAALKSRAALQSTGGA